MPSAPRRRPGQEPARAVPRGWRPGPGVLLAIAFLLTAGARHVQQVRAVTNNSTADHPAPSAKVNSKMPQEDNHSPIRTFELVSTSADKDKNDKEEVQSKVAEDASSNDMPAAMKQYEYSLLHPYGSIITAYPGGPSTPSWPAVEILDSHRNPPFVNAPFVTQAKPNHHVMGSPMLSTVVVQDMSQSAIPRPPISLETGDTTNVHHLGSHKVPLTDVKIVSKPLYGKPSDDSDPNFTDKVEESELSDESEEDDGGLAEDSDAELLENPPQLDMGGIVEDALRDVFKKEKVLPLRTWPCPAVTCCTKPTRKARRKQCSSVIKCSSDQRPNCPATSPEMLPTPQALAFATHNDSGNSTENADVRDGEPRFKKKKIVKKKKKFLKKFMMPLLFAYKLLFLVMVPLLVNGMMMMMSSSGMAGFFFALIGASVAMVRVYTGGMRVIPSAPPPPNKVVKVIKYVEAPTAPVQMSTLPPPPPPTPTPTVPPTTVIHHQPLMEDHFPTFHAPPPPPPPPYGSYYPHPYMTRYYDRSGAFEGGRRKRRRRKDTLLPQTTDLDGTLTDLSQHDYWLTE